MARRRPTPKRQGAYGQFLDALERAGCVLCLDCYAYMPPGHVAHASLVGDRHVSTLRLEGGFGDVQIITVEPTPAVAA